MSRSRGHKPKVRWDPTALFERALIGCTTVTSKDDPELENGIALTALDGCDLQYVRFEDIDGEGDMSFRFWKDVYLIISFDDPNYAPLGPGDTVFALYPNDDHIFTTIYYRATLKAVNARSVTVDYVESDSGSYTNISLPLSANVGCVFSENRKITVPTVIRLRSAEGTPMQRAYLKQLQADKAKGNAKPPKPRKNRDRSTTSSAHEPRSHSRTRAHDSQSKSKSKSRSRSQHSDKKKSVPIAIANQQTQQKKPINISDSDSDAAIITSTNIPHSNSHNHRNIPMPIKLTSHRQKSQNVPTNTKKRKYIELTKGDSKNDEFKKNESNSLSPYPPQPPSKRQRILQQRKKQKLKKTLTMPPTTNQPKGPKLITKSQTQSQPKNDSNHSDVSLLPPPPPIAAVPSLPSTAHKSSSSSNANHNAHKKPFRLKLKRKKSANTAGTHSPAYSVSSVQSIATSLPQPQTKNDHKKLPPMSSSTATVPTTAISPVPLRETAAPLMSTTPLLPPPPPMPVFHGTETGKVTASRNSNATAAISKPSVSASASTSTKTSMAVNMNSKPKAQLQRKPKRTKLKRVYGAYHVEMPDSICDAANVSADLTEKMKDLQNVVKCMKSMRIAKSKDFVSDFGIYSDWTEKKKFDNLYDNQRGFIVSPYVRKTSMKRNILT